MYFSFTSIQLLWWMAINFFETAVQSLSCVQLFVNPWTEACQAFLPFTIPRICSNSCLLSQWCHPTISSSVVTFSSLLQSFPASESFHELVLHIRWPKYCSFRFSINPSNKYSGLISFRMDWLDGWMDLLAVQGTLKGLLQHHSSKASILQHSAFFIIQLSHLYMTTGETTALTMGPIQ